MPISEVYNMDCMEYMKGIPDNNNLLSIPNSNVYAARIDGKEKYG